MGESQFQHTIAVISELPPRIVGGQADPANLSAKLALTQNSDQYCYYSSVASFRSAKNTAGSYASDCVLLDIRSSNYQLLDAIRLHAIKLPVLALVTEHQAIPTAMLTQHADIDLVGEQEFDTPLFHYRVSQAIRNHAHPLRLGVLHHPLLDLFQCIIDHTSDWIIVKDLDHRFLMVTQAFRDAVGRPDMAIIGKNDLEIGSSESDVYGDPKTGWQGFWPQDDQVTSSGIASVEDNPNWQVFSAAPRHKRTLRIPLKNLAGEVYALLVCTQDITEQKQNERMLRDRTEMLSRVTREKQNAENHRQIAERAVNTKNRFLAAASHDLRQPLHAMGLFLDVLESRMSEQEDLQLMRKLKQSTVSLNNLFNSLLDISRLDAGVVEPQMDHIPLMRLLDSLCEDFRHLAAEKNLHFSGTAEDAVVLSDFVLLSRIVRNLVVNAIDNTRQGSVNLNCQRGRDGKHLVLISDTGPGIPPAEHARIFDEFHQITSTQTQRGKGIGLGLAIVKRLCELLDIDIHIESTLGKGTCFMLHVPAGKAERVVQETTQHTELTLQGLTILIIDDDVSIREGMEALLQLYGCDTFSAGSLDEVFDKLSGGAQQPDLIMADYDLGQELTGDKVVENLCRELGTRIPALLITGDTSIDPEHNTTSGNMPVLHKPINPEEMVRLIAKELARPSAPV